MPRLLPWLSLILPLATALPSQRAVHAIPHKHLLLRRSAALNTTAGGTMLASDVPMVLVDKYAGSDFFDKFDFFNGPDPTHGLNDYVGREEAMSSGLAFVQGGTAVLAVDDKSAVPVGGRRKSVRITSKKEYRGGLFVMDLSAAATGCGVWPSFWTNGPDWPRGGEIDILEGVNLQTQNQMTLHTKSGCSLDASAAPFGKNAKAFSGRVLSTKCDADAGGCGILDEDDTSFGAGVKNKGGAVYAMLWDSVGIRIWRFDAMPPDVAKDAPNPVEWPAPVAFWSVKECSMDEFFPAPHRIIINIALCGDWAGSVYPSSGCPGTCEQAISDPKNFVDAKMEIASLAVYQWLSP